MDASIIPSVEAGFRRAQMAMNVDLIGKDLKKVYKAEKQTAKKILKRSWEGPTLHNIRLRREQTRVSPNCFKVLAVGQDKCPAEGDTVVFQTQVSLASETTKRLQIDVDQLLSTSWELECTENVNSLQMIFDAADELESNNDEDPVPHTHSPVKEQRRALSIAERTLGDKGATFNSAISALSPAKANLRLEAAERAQKT